MFSRARKAKTPATSLVSPSKAKRKLTRSSIQKKTPVKKPSPTKRQLEQTPTSAIQPRQKRLSSLTATALLQYCSTILSPSRKQNQPTLVSTEEAKTRKVDPPCDMPIRTRREASSRASAMILQQNEIERSRYSYARTNENCKSTTLPRSSRKAPVPPPPPPPPARSITTSSAQSSMPVVIQSIHSFSSTTISKLTESSLAEHDRFHGTTTASSQSIKHENLIKWTQELALCGRLSPPPCSEHDFPPTLDHSTATTITPPTFLVPSSSHSFYPLLPCWQYPIWPFLIRRVIEDSKQKQDFHPSTDHHVHISKSLNTTKTTSIETSRREQRMAVGTRGSSPVQRRVSPRLKSLSLSSRNLRGKRTKSASIVSVRSRSSTSRKRAHSAASITSKSVNSRKKQKTTDHWILFGKSEPKLISLQPDKPAVFRQCYSSIRHITENDVIKSNDCVILRSESGGGSWNDATPYIAKVQWFWEEPATGEIRMSLFWYYHPEHTELSTRVKERFLANELLASKHSDCLNVACIEDKCYVLTSNEYNRYSLRETPSNLFEPVGQLKSLLNKNTPTVHHRSLPGKTVGNPNIFFCRHVYDYRVKRILKNPLSSLSM